MKPSFEEIVAEYTQRIYYVVRRIVTDHSDTDDVVQNTFIKAWQNYESFRGDASVYTWLYRIAVNEALTFLRNSKKRENTISLDDIHTLFDSDQYFDAEGAEKALCMAVDSLPPKQKAVFVMRYFDETPYTEMAVIMGTSTGALKASYHHAQKKVEEALNFYMYK
ncbi:MAG: RNA polymerase sigma factor [Rikenellaceae bacterium]